MSAGEWNYNLDEAPLYHDVLVTWVVRCDGPPKALVNEGYRTRSGSFERMNGNEISNVIAWMPLPDAAVVGGGL